MMEGRSKMALGDKGMSQGVAKRFIFFLSALGSVP